MRTEIIKHPRIKILIKDSNSATDYFSYCEENGCDVWDDLKKIDPSKQPIAIWLPDGRYVQGIETDHINPDYKVITLPEMTLLQVQGEPYIDENYQIAIQEVQDYIESNIKTKENGYRFQFEPMGEQGYIELVEID